ncbi:unnamed protein product [Pedinophyceae sp. YPF-701]|nr:unnamed protein product [Pedinophyceae sp. YPF-701]
MPSFKEVRKRCPTCDYAWLDKYNKPECPKCLKPLGDGHGLERKLEGVDISGISKGPADARESQSGTCPKGGMHHWKYGKCNKCNTPEGYKDGPSKAPSFPGGKNLACSKAPDGGKHVFKFSKCKYCGVSEYGSSAAPKATVPRKAMSVLSKAADAGEGESGECPRGGPHTWKFGKCSKCQVGQGYEAHKTTATHFPGGASMACPRSPTNKHQFKFGKCTHCAQPEYDPGSTKPGEVKTHVRGVASDAKERMAGVCPMGDQHHFKFGICIKCKVDEGYQGAGAPPKSGQFPGGKDMACPQAPDGGKHVFKFSKCTMCGVSEYDKSFRAGIESSKVRLAGGAGDPRESHSGDCPKGELHHWRYGKCVKCGVAEGYGGASAPPKAAAFPGGRNLTCPKAPDNGKHKFKYSKCEFCGGSEFDYL